MQGIIKTATSDSDSHSTAIVQAGGPRNFVASSSDDPVDLDDAELAASVRQGRLIGEGGHPALAYSNPLFIDTDVNGRFDAPRSGP